MAGPDREAGGGRDGGDEPDVGVGVARVHAAAVGLDDRGRGREQPAQGKVVLARAEDAVDDQPVFALGKQQAALPAHVGRGVEPGRVAAPGPVHLGGEPPADVAQALAGAERVLAPDLGRGAVDHQRVVAGIGEVGQPLRLVVAVAARGGDEGAAEGVEIEGQAGALDVVVVAVVQAGDHRVPGEAVAQDEGAGLGEDPAGVRRQPARGAGGGDGEPVRPVVEGGAAREPAAEALQVGAVELADGVVGFLDGGEPVHQALDAGAGARLEHVGVAQPGDLRVEGQRPHGGPAGVVRAEVEALERAVGPQLGLEKPVGELEAALAPGRRGLALGQQDAGIPQAARLAQPPDPRMPDGAVQDVGGLGDDGLEQPELEVRGEVRGGEEGVPAADEAGLGDGVGEPDGVGDGELVPGPAVEGHPAFQQAAELPRHALLLRGVAAEVGEVHRPQPVHAPEHGPGLVDRLVLAAGPVDATGPVDRLVAGEVEGLAGGVEPAGRHVGGQVLPELLGGGGGAPGHGGVVLGALRVPEVEAAGRAVGEVMGEQELARRGQVGAGDGGLDGGEPRRGEVQVVEEGGHGAGGRTGSGGVKSRSPPSRCHWT